MKRQPSRERQRERRTFRRKVLASVVLVVIFGFVVFTVPAERLAWQGAYVMGTLLLPAPSKTYVRPDAMRENSDSFFSFLAFLSVAGILGLLAKKLHDKLPGRGETAPDRGRSPETES